MAQETPTLVEEYLEESYISHMYPALKKIGLHELHTLYYIDMNDLNDLCKELKLSIINKTKLKSCVERIKHEQTTKTVQLQSKSHKSHKNDYSDNSDNDDDAELRTEDDCKNEHINDIDNQEDAQKSDQFETNWDKVVESFDDMNLKEDLLRGIYAYGFLSLEKPLAIQQRAILPIIQKRDIIARTQSGTWGLTIAYSIAALQRVDVKDPQCQVLILSPTHELAQANHSKIKSLGSYLEVTTRACVGGTDVREDIQQLANGVQIVVGTVGRVNDMISRGVLSLKALKLFVVDDADHMFYGAFKEQIYECFQYLPSEVQVGVFSRAMLPNANNYVLHLSQRLMRNPIRILEKKEVTLDRCKQYYIAVEKEDYKLATIYDLLETLTINGTTIIYCNTRRTVVWLTDALKRHDLSVSSMHGDHTRILVTMDSSTGVIYSQIVTLVINYDLPMNRENYIRRIRQTGGYRNGGIGGVAINFVRDEDEPKLRDIETFYNIKIDEIPIEVDSIVC